MKKLLILMITSAIILNLSACSKLKEEKQVNNNITVENSSQNNVGNGVEHGKIESNTTKLSKEDQEAIIARYEEMQTALINHDTEKLDKLLPDDYIARHISGRRQTKEEWLNDIANGEMRYFEFSDVHYSLSQEGDIVKLGVRQKIHAKIYGVDSTWSVPGDREFIKQDGVWKIAG